MVKISGNMSKEETHREHNGNSTEFKFNYKSYFGVVTRITDLVSLMSSMSKMRTEISDRSATESWLIPSERVWDKDKHKKQKEQDNENCKRWGHNDVRE